MRSLLSPTLAALLGAVLLAGCASTGRAPAVLASAEPDFTALGNVRNPRLTLASVSPDPDFAGYRRLAFRTGEFQYRDVAPVSSTFSSINSTRQEFPVSERDQVELDRLMNEVFREELGSSNRFELVEADAGGDGLLILEARLYDVMLRVPPEPAGRSRIFVDTVGEATLVLELMDGTSGRVLARTADRRAAEPAGRGNFGALRASPVTAWQEVRRVVRRWAVATREQLEGL